MKKKYLIFRNHDSGFVFYYLQQLRDHCTYFQLAATYLEEVNWSYQDLNCFSYSLLL